MAHPKHKTVIKTKKFAVETCGADREDYVVLRLWSANRKNTVHHHLKPKEAQRLAAGILTAAN